MASMRAQVIAAAETVTSFGLSAEARFFDAQHLLAGGRLVGALYCAGLSAEMWLKLACFRRLGADAASPVGPFARRVETFMMMSMTLSSHKVFKESGHSLRYWADFLIRFEDAPSGSLGRDLAGDLRHHVVNRLYDDWHLFLRYREMRVPSRHMQRVLADVGWLRANWTVLGRR